MYIVESNGEKSFINPKLLEMVTLSIEEYGCEYDFLEEEHKNFGKFWNIMYSSSRNMGCNQVFETEKEAKDEFQRFCSEFKDEFFVFTLANFDGEFGLYQLAVRKSEIQFLQVLKQNDTLLLTIGTSEFEVQIPENFENLVKEL